MTKQKQNEIYVQKIATEFGGILPYHEAFYINSIIYSASAADDAFERFAHSVVREDADEVIVSAVHEALTHSAALSRFFWPARKDNKIAPHRARKLREAFKMDGSCLENRDLRNALEHFDERLDVFLSQDPMGNLFPAPMVAPHNLLDEEVTKIFRLVDPFEFIFAIFGEKYNFYRIRLEINRILKLARQFDENGSRLPHNTSPPSLTAST